MMRRFRPFDTCFDKLSTAQDDVRGRRGSLLIDALLAIAIFGVVVTSFSSGIVGGQMGAVRGGNRTRAAFLADEGLEAVRSVRDRVGFANLAGSGVRLVNNSWVLLPGSTVIDGLYTRSIVISNTEPPDDDMKKVTSTVTWTEQPNDKQLSVSLETYLSDWRSNPPAADPPDPPAPVPDWSIPIVVGNVTDASDNYQKVAVHGTGAYVVGSDKNAPGFYLYDIAESHITSPELEESIDINSDTYQSYNVAIKGNYAYIATNDTSGDVKIMDISQRPLTCCAATITLAGSSKPRGLALSGSKLYIAQGPAETAAVEFARYDVTTPTSPTADGGINDDTLSMYDVIIYGTGAYVAADDPGEIKVFDIGKFPNPEDEGGRDLSITGQAYAVGLVSTGAFLGTKNQMGGYEVFGFETSGGSNPFPESGRTDLNGFTIYENVFDMATSTGQLLGFLATDRKINSGGLKKTFFIVMNFAGVHDIESASQTVYNGTILDTVVTGSSQDGNGIVLRESDQTAFFVAGNPDTFPSGLTQGDFVILRPTYP